MTNRLTAALALGGIAAFAAGCSTSGGGALPTGTAAQESSSWAQPSRTHVKIREFSDLPQYADYYSPSSVAAASGTLWVADEIDQDFGENAVVQIATSGKAINAFYYPGLSSEGASFLDIAAGPDGALWITDYYNEQVVRMTTHGVFTNFPLNDYTAPSSITSGPDRALWFTAENTAGYAVGRITTGGRITMYPVPEALDIASGPDGALWFTEPSNGRVGRISTRGKVTEYSNGITAGSQPYSIAAGADGALWFTERAGGRIGRITTNGKVTEYSRGITPTEEPFDLAGGPGGAMWFTEYESYGSYLVRASKVARITARGRIQEFSGNLDPKAGPTEITEGPDSRMWFVESSADRTGRLTI